jgi:hypothetical protein
MLIVYVAHKFGGDLANADKAEKWTAWLNLHIERAAFICPWLPMVRHWVDSGKTRARGLVLDVFVARRCDATLALTAVEGGVLEEWKASKYRRCLIAPTSDEDDLTGFMVNVQSWIDWVIGDMSSDPRS